MTKPEVKIDTFVISLDDQLTVRKLHTSLLGAENILLKLQAEFNVKQLEYGKIQTALTEKVQALATLGSVDLETNQFDLDTCQFAPRKK